MKGLLERSRFTLVELLVVIAVIAVLLSLLMPALKGAMEKCTALKCAGNLKQVGIALCMYVSDHDGVSPVICVNPKIDDTYHWFGNPGIWPYLSSKEAKTAGAFANSIVNCPKSGGYAYLAYSYGRMYTYNLKLFKDGSWPNYCNLAPPRLSKVATPSGTIEVYESLDTTSHWSPYFWYVNYAPWHHSNGINSLFIDGHVAWRKRGGFPASTSDVIWTGGLY